MDDNLERLETKQGNLIPLLVKAIQELSSELNSLKTEVTILKTS